MESFSRGHPFIIFTVGHICINSLITSAQNSLPLSDCKIVGGEPTKWKSSKRYAATSIALFEVRALAQENLVKWSLTWHTYLNSLSESYDKSIRSI